MDQRTAGEYFQRCLETARMAASTQLAAVEQAAANIATCITSGGRFVLFGTGHSHLLVEEAWGRAGGLVEVYPVLEPSLMLHEGLHKSSRLERLPGLGAELAQLHQLVPNDAVLIASNSGRNAVPVEFAEQAQQVGATVIALTSLNHSTSVTSRARSGLRLSEIADVVIDNCGVVGDACIANDPHPIGPTSTVVGAMLINALAVEVVGQLSRQGNPPATFLSLNVGQ